MRSRVAARVGWPAITRATVRGSVCAATAIARAICAGRRRVPGPFFVSILLTKVPKSGAEGDTRNPRMRGAATPLCALKSPKT
jgi:hypothetical protein